MQKRYETFTNLISKVSRFIRKIKTEEVAELNLKSPHVSCLYYLGRYDGITASEICDLSAEDKSSISRSVEYLEENGYIVCSSDAKKRYKAGLTLTEKGGQVSKRMEEKIAAVLAEAGDGISEADLKIFYDTLKVICGNLQKISGER